MLNTNRKARERNIGAWLPIDEAESFKAAAAREGGVSEVIRRFVRRYLRSRVGKPRSAADRVRK